MTTSTDTVPPVVFLAGIVVFVLWIVLDRRVFHTLERLHLANPLTGQISSALCLGGGTIAVAVGGWRLVAFLAIAMLTLVASLFSLKRWGHD